MRDTGRKLDHSLKSRNSLVLHAVEIDGSLPCPIPKDRLKRILYDPSDTTKLQTRKQGSSQVSDREPSVYVPCTGQSWSGVCASAASRRRIYALVRTPPHSRGMVPAGQARKRLASRGVATLAQLGGPRVPKRSEGNPPL